MCINCAKGGFHQPAYFRPKNLSDNLPLGLVDQEWKDYMELSGHLDDNDVDVYVAPDLPQETQTYAKELISQINEVTEFDIVINNNKSKADVIMDDRVNYDFMGELYSDAAGLAYWEDGKTYATWREKYSQPHTNYKGEEKLTRLSKHIIAHELLHTLGLSHPFDRGYNPNYTNADSVMSYNIGYLYDNPIQTADVTALQILWG